MDIDFFTDVVLRTAYHLGYQSYSDYMLLGELRPRRVLERSFRFLSHEILDDRLSVGTTLWDEAWIDGWFAAERALTRVRTDSLSVGHYQVNGVDYPSWAEALKVARALGLRRKGRWRG